MLSFHHAGTLTSLQGSFDHEYPSLGVGGASRASWQPQSPRMPPSESPADAHWTSRLADVPANVTAHPLLPNGSSTASAVAAAAQPQPRMADAIQQVGVGCLPPACPDCQAEARC